MKKQKPKIDKKLYEAIFTEMKKWGSLNHPKVINEIKKQFTESINLRKRKQP